MAYNKNTIKDKFYTKFVTFTQIRFAKSKEKPS